VKTSAPALCALLLIVTAATTCVPDDGASGSQEALAEARLLRKQGELAAASALLEPLRDSADPTTRAQALGLLGRISLSRGDVDRALDELRESEALAREVGDLTLAAQNALASAHLLRRQRNDLSGARQRLALSADLFASLPALRPEYRYQLGLLSMYGGRVREALALFEQAESDAAALGIREVARDARAASARLTFALGRAHEAFQTLHALIASETDPCARATLQTTLGWLSLVAEREERPGTSLDMAALKAAREAYRGRCQDGGESRNASLNLALAHLTLGDPQSARAYLAEARGHSAQPSAAVAAYEALLEAELALSEGDIARALAHYEQLSLDTRVIDPHGLRLRIESGRARALELGGHVGQAERAYARAESLLESELDFLPFSFGREAYLRPHESVSMRRMELYVARGELDRAFHVARAARTRLLRGLVRTFEHEQLDEQTFEKLATLERQRHALHQKLEQHQREGWRVPRAELTLHEQQGSALARQKSALEDAMLALLPPSPGVVAKLERAPSELVLGLFASSGGIRVFAAFDDALETFVIGKALPRDGAAWASALLEPLRGKLERADRVSVIADAALGSLDVHALPFRGEPLIAHLPVSYRVDIAGQSARSQGPALLVADPRRDLPFAAESALSPVLSRGGALSSLYGAAATRERTLDALGQASTFVYEGHSERSDAGTLSSALLLSHGDRLQVLDVLMLKSVPARVVLSSCDSARATGADTAVGVGLAEAFVARGAHIALGTTEPVPDAVSGALSEALAQDGDPRFDLGHFTRALGLVARRDASRNWARYRVLVR
jgi:tetratricopeptide (TPR) repeat protein